MEKVIQSEYGLVLSEPRRVETKYGPKLVQEAEPTEEFWEAWKKDKAAMKAEGWGCGMWNGEWRVTRWSDVPEEEIRQREQLLEISRATDADVEIPAPEGLSYLGYQKAGIHFALNSLTGNVLIGDEMGLGKTVMAIGIICATRPKRVLVVCPASLKLNWKRELEKWLTIERTVGVADSQTWPRTDIVIINYDVLDRWEIPEFDLLVGDEIHYVKNPKARRSKLFYGIKAGRRVYLTGTPIPNRPKELFPIINSLDPETWPNFFSFAKRYCGAVYNGWGWDCSGASNLEELQAKLRSSIMVRRLKKDVLTELPPKIRQVIPISPNGAEPYIKAEREAWTRQEKILEELQAALELSKASDDPEDYKAAIEALKQGVKAAFEEVAKMRRETAKAKVPYLIEHIKQTDGKVVIFAHHKEVIRRLMETLGSKAVSITGDTPIVERQAAVDRFQNDPGCLYFVGSIGAAGVGLTLTASSHVVFGELDWVPGNLSQSEDRLHRYGQTNSVLVQHLVFDGSIDCRMVEKIIEKQEIIDRALDSGATLDDIFKKMPENQVPAIPTASRTDTATGKLSPEWIEKEAETITREQIEAAHEALQLLAANDPDRAAMKNDAGFNRIDNRIGHDLASRSFLTPKQGVLARRIARKYRRQLPEELLEKMNK